MPKQLINLSNILELQKKAKYTNATGDDIAAFNEAFERLNQAVENVNGRATAFTLSSRNILDLAADSEMWLDRHDMSKKSRVGVSVFHRPAGPSASSYKYRVATTEVVIVRRTSGWVLSEIKRGSVNPKQGATTRYVIDEATRDVIVRNALAGTEIKAAA